MVGGGPEDGKWNQGRGRRGGGRRVAGKKRVIFCLFWPRPLDGISYGADFVACGRKRRRLCSSVSRAFLLIARVHASMRQDGLLGSCEAAIGVAARWKGRLLDQALHSRWTSNQDIQPCKAASSAALITSPILPFGTVVTLPPTSQLLPLKSVSVEFHALLPTRTWSSPKCSATQRNASPELLLSADAGWRARKN